MKKKKTIILAVLLVLAIGFAAVSTTLYINGTVGFGTNKADYDVRFITAKLDNVDISSTAISTDGKTIDFTAELKSLSDATRVLDYTILNNSSQYDAAVTIDCTDIKVVDSTSGNERAATDAEKAYITVTNDHTTQFKIDAKQTEDGKLSVKLNKSATEAITFKIKCKATADAVSRNKSGIVKADEIALTGLEDITYNGSPITSVDQALNYLYENR